MKRAWSIDSRMAWLWGIFVLELAFIFFILLNYYFAWISNENDLIHTKILSNGKSWQWADWLRFLDCSIVEGYGDRYTRPLCDFFQILNSKFRAFCWQYIPPHPSLSILWPACFIIIPVYLYKFFRIQGCYAPVAFAGVCLYMASVGFLSPIVMYLHPGKVLVNICAVIVLYWGSVLNKISLGKEILWQWCGFLSFIFFSFLCDESALFLYVIAFFTVTQCLFKHKKRLWLWVTFLFVPVLYFLAIKYILPYIHFLYMHEVVDLRRYYQYPKAAMIFQASWWKMYGETLSFFLYDHPHFQLNMAQLLPYNKPLFIIQAMYIAVVGGVAVLFLKSLFKKPTDGLLRIVVVALTILGFVFFHTLLMSVAWGNWYYGALYTLLYFIFLTFVFQFILERENQGLLRKFFPVVVLVMVVHTMAFSFYRVDIFDTTKMVWTQRYTLNDIFTGKTGDYFKELNLAEGVQKSDCRYWYTVLAWKKARGKVVEQELENKVNRCIPTLQQDRAFFVDKPYWSFEI